MSEKAASGADKVIGTNAIDRFASRHPVMTGLLKNAGKAVGMGIGIKETGDILP